MIEPQRGQSAQQQNKDAFECYTLARGQSGFDPMAPRRPAVTPTRATEGDGSKTPAGETPSATATAAISGNNANSAGIATGMSGAAVAEKASPPRLEQPSQEQTPSAQQQRTDYERAVRTCMEGRGYLFK